VTTASGDFTLKDTGFMPLSRFLGGPVRPVRVSEARGTFERNGAITRVEKLVLDSSVGKITGQISTNDSGIADLNFRGEIDKLEALIDLWPSFNDRVRGGQGELVVAVRGPLRNPRAMKGTVDIAGRGGALTIENVSELYAVHPFEEMSTHLVLPGDGSVVIDSTKMRGPKSNLDGSGVVTADGRVELKGKAYFTDSFTKKVFKPKFLYPIARLFGWGKLKSDYQVKGTLAEARLTMGITKNTIWKLGVKNEVPEHLRKIATGEKPLWSADVPARSPIAAVAVRDR
jgi:hypothetical protein